jgi:hypothetical protein
VGWGMGQWSSRGAVSWRNFFWDTHRSALRVLTLLRLFFSSLFFSFLFFYFIFLVLDSASPCVSRLAFTVLLESEKLEGVNK